MARGLRAQHAVCNNCGDHIVRYEIERGDPSVWSAWRHPTEDGEVLWCGVPEMAEPKAGTISKAG